MYTVHTMESMLNLRVHIAPVGFEIDRVVVPAAKMKADLVYLIADENVATDKSTKFQSEIIKKLKRKKLKKQNLTIHCFILREFSWRINVSLWMK